MSQLILSISFTGTEFRAKAFFLFFFIDDWVQEQEFALCYTFIENQVIENTLKQ